MDYVLASVRPKMIHTNNLCNELNKYEEFIGRCQQSAIKLMDSKFGNVSTSSDLESAFSNI